MQTSYLTRVLIVFTFKQVYGERLGFKVWRVFCYFFFAVFVQLFVGFDY